MPTSNCSSRLTRPVTPSAIISTVRDDERLWTHKPAPAVAPRRGENVWTRLKGTRVAECELRYHGEYGVEAQFYRDGEFFSSRRFDLKAEALQWAQLERQELERDGWTVPISR
jgi:hypothetical protein